jgi:hypothetical protein
MFLLGGAINISRFQSEGTPRPLAQDLRSVDYIMLRHPPAQDCGRRVAIDRNSLLEMQLESESQSVCCMHSTIFRYRQGCIHESKVDHYPGQRFPSGMWRQDRGYCGRGGLDGM